MKTQYINSVKMLFQHYKNLGRKTFDQLEDRDLFHRFDPESNSIAIIVNHLWGNMKSRWTEFLTSDGEKDWRERDLEFEDVIHTRGELLTKWEDGWKCLFDALDTINEDNFDTTVYIRNQAHSIMDAVNRQLGHYAYHVGQIVFIGRILKGDAWQSLSVPKGKSSEFNDAKFSKGKHGGHFTDDFRDGK